MDTVFFHGRLYEVIETFSEFLLIQHPISKEIFLISYDSIDSAADLEYNKSNVLSFEGYKSWVERTKISKQSQQNQPKELKQPAKVIFLKWATR